MTTLAIHPSEIYAPHLDAPLPPRNGALPGDWVRHRRNLKPARLIAPSMLAPFYEPSRPAQKPARARPIPLTASERMALVTRPPRITIRFIVAICASYYEIGLRRVLGKRRTKDVIRPRLTAMFIARGVFGKTLSEIGRAMSRDHTSVLSGYRKIGAEVQRDFKAMSDVAEIVAGVVGAPVRREMAGAMA